MIAGMIGYKLAVKNSRWGDAIIFGILAMLLTLLLNKIIDSFFQINFMGLGLIVCGISAFIIAKNYNKFNQKLSMDIAVKTIVVSIIVMILMFAFVGFAFLAIFVGMAA